MNPSREEALFAAALEQPPAERAAFLSGACLGDAALRQRVEALLAAHDATANPLHTATNLVPTILLDLAELPDEAVGQTLGRYKLLEKIGEGLHGMMLAVSNLALSHDNRCLAASSNGREAVRLWQVETGQDLLTLPGKGSQLSTLAFAENGNTILVGGRGKPGTWQMWRAPSWDVIRAVEAQEKSKTKEP